MKRVLLCFAMLFSIQVFAAQSSPTWPKNITEKLQQSFQEGFCKNPDYQLKGACATLTKKGNGILNSKVTSVAIQGRSLTITDGKRSLQITRTANPTQFEINRKIIDISQHRSFESLNQALDNMIPKVAHVSLWMNTAFAADVGIPSVEEPSVTKLKTASAFIMFHTSGEDLCNAVRDFVAACEENISTSSSTNLFKAILRKMESGKELDKDDRRMFLGVLDDFLVQLYQMNKVTKGFNADKMKAIAACSSVKPGKGRTGAQDITDCSALLEDGMKDIRSLKKDLDPEEQKIQKKAEKIQEETGELTGTGGKSETPPPKKKTTNAVQ